MADHPSTGLKQSIDEDLVRHIGFLIRLDLTDQEVKIFSGQLSAILDYFDRLNEVDVEGVPPYRQPQMERPRLREDVVQPSMNREDFLANVPQAQAGYVKVSVVLDVPDES
jgi:aspartyl-tRNA(Asn)/glutamyl-tRNA(Gln) amidotransferase subunit C